MKMPRLASSTPWGAGLASLLMLSLLCGLVVYWGLAIASPAVSIAPAGSLVSQNTGMDTRLASTMFGRADGSAPIASAPLPRNIQIVGIAASADRSAVIVSVDGQNAAAFGVGQQIDDSLKVVSVDTVEVILDHRGEMIRVPAPASGDLSALNSKAGNTTSDRAAPASASAQNPQSGQNSPAGRQQPSHNALAPRRLAGTASPNQSARPPLPPRTLPPAGAAAAPAQPSLQRPQPQQARAGGAERGSGEGPGRPQTALGRALQQVERPAPVVRQ